MNARSIAAVVVIVLGIVALAYSGIRITTPDDYVDFLGERVETRDTHGVPPVVGGIVLVGGVVLLGFRPRSA